MFWGEYKMYGIILFHSIFALIGVVGSIIALIENDDTVLILGFMLMMWATIMLRFELVEK